MEFFIKHVSILAVINWCDCIVNRRVGETWN